MFQNFLNVAKDIINIFKNNFFFKAIDSRKFWKKSDEKSPAQKNCIPPYKFQSLLSFAV